LEKISNKIQSLFQSSWFIAAMLLAVFFLSTSYKYGWDDQHLEIPLLKHLIDDTLYQGDYYVESLTQNFSSYFYPLLSRFIKVSQIPTAYFILYVLARYFLFFWIYKLWLFISKDRFKAIACILTLILVVRVNEFLYRTFSHQEFTLPIILAGIYYFFRGRFWLAAAILGIAANLHALYSLFPFLFMMSYLLGQIRKYGWQTFMKAGGTFVVFSFPFLIWCIQNRLSMSGAAIGDGGENWLQLFITACPQNFFFPQAPQIPYSKLLSSWTVFFQATQSYWYLIILFVLNVIFNKPFRSNKRALAFSLTAFGLLVLCFVFTYLYPHRFFIDLNLTRNTQFLMFLLIGYTTILVMNTVEQKPYFWGLCGVVMFSLLKFGGSIAMLAVGGIFFVCLGIHFCPKKKVIGKISSLIAVLGFLGCLGMIVHLVKITPYAPVIYKTFYAVAGLLGVYSAGYWFLRNSSKQILFKRILIFIPLVVFLVQFTYYRQQRLKTETSGPGFWELQRNWENMQEYVKNNTPKDAMILVPYNMEMGGFRILSERKIICSYRDCGIIGFDYQSAVEWQKRVQDIEPFKFVVQDIPKKAIENAIYKYKANYIVFMSYAAPPRKNQFFQYIYGNKYFTLFKVMILH